MGHKLIHDWIRTGVSRIDAVEASGVIRPQTPQQYRVALVAAPRLSTNPGDAGFDIDRATARRGTDVDAREVAGTACEAMKDAIARAEAIARTTGDPAAIQESREPPKFTRTTAEETGTIGREADISLAGVGYRRRAQLVRQTLSPANFCRDGTAVARSRRSTGSKELEAANRTGD
jgi:hypothetical protein